jgi:hypothetical protein
MSATRAEIRNEARNEARNQAVELESEYGSLRTDVSGGRA